MGRIKKAAADKHGATLPPVLSEFVNSLATVPIHEIPEKLRTFPKHWPFPRGDLYHWIPVLDRFDEVLEEIVLQYGLQNGPQIVPFGQNYLLSKCGPLDDSKAYQDKLDSQYGADADKSLVESVLQFSRKLMDNCGNRSLYNSSERLNDLLNTTSLPVVQEILRLASSHYRIDLERIQDLADPFVRLPPGPTPVNFQDITRKGKEKSTESAQENVITIPPNDLMALLDANLDDKALSDYTSVSFKYYPQAAQPSEGESRALSSDESAKTPPTPTPIRRSSGLSKQHRAQDGDSLPSPDKVTFTPVTTTDSNQRTINIDTETLRKRSLESILSQYLPGIPKRVQFYFLVRLQIAKSLMGGRDRRMDILEIRLLALQNLSYILPEKEFHTKLLIHDSDEPRRLQVVNQLAEIVRPTVQTLPDSKRMPLVFRTTAISTLESLSKHKSRFGDVCAALQINVNHGIVFQILHEAIAELSDDDERSNEAEEEWRDALLSLLETLPSIGTNTRTADTLISAGFFDMLVKELGLRTTKAERVHHKVLMFVITMSHIVRDALQTFANSKGFDAVSDLLAYEVRTAIEDVKAGNAIPNTHRSPIMDYQMSFFKQQTLRWLFKFINSMLSQQGGNVERLIRNLIDSPPLLTALREVMKNAEIFGATTWSGAINVLSSFIHNEPTSYAVIVEAGLSKTLVEAISRKPAPEIATEPEENDASGEASKILRSGPDSVKVYRQAATNLATEASVNISLQRTSDKPLAAGILVATEPIIQIPHALGALCLNPSGLELFLKSDVLDAYLEIFESPAHVKILVSDFNAPKTIGTTFDELMRHHPRLKHTIIRAVVISLARVTYLCKTLSLQKNETAKAATTGHESSFSTGPSNGDVEMTGVSISPTAQNSKTVKDEPNACDYLSAMVHFLQGFCENSTACSSLIQANAVTFLLDLATSPSLPYNFNSRSEGIELSRVVHSLIDSKPHLVLPSVLVRMEESLEKLEPLLNHQEPVSFFSEYIFESSETSSIIENSEILRALVEVHTLTNIVGEALSTPIIPTSRNASSLFLLVNLTDYWTRIVQKLTRLQPVCVWEEILLLKNLPTDLKKSTFDTNVLKTGVDEADRALGIQQSSEPNSEGGEVTGSDSPAESVAKTGDKSHKYRSENIPALRFILSQLPLTITPLLQGLARSLVTKKRHEPYSKQNAYALAGVIVSEFLKQLSYTRAIECQELTDRFKFFMVVLTAFSKLVIDNSPDLRLPQCLTLLLVMFKRQADGLGRINELLDVFYQQIQTNTDGDTELNSCAAGGMKIILTFYSQLVSSKYILDSSQSQVLQGSERDNRDKEAYHYFSATQLLLDLRVKILAIVKPIWDSNEADKLSMVSVKCMIDIIRTTFDSNTEDGVRKRSDGAAMIRPLDLNAYHTSRDRKTVLRAQGASDDLAEEACYRLLNGREGSEEYVDMHLRHMDIPRLPLPENGVRQNLPRLPSISSLMNPRNASDTTLPETSTEANVNNSRQIFTSDAGPGQAVQRGRITSDEFPPLHSDEDEDDTDIFAGLTGDEANDEDDEGNGMAMNIDNQLNLSESVNTTVSAQAPSNSIISPLPRPEKIPAPEVYTLEDLNEMRQSIRDNLMEQVSEVMSAHEGLTFELSDLIISATKNSEDKGMRALVGTILIQYLVSFTDDDFTKEGKRIADRASLLAVVMQDSEFFQVASHELREQFSELVKFIQLPKDEEHTATSSPWVSQILVLIEKVLGEDTLPVAVDWTAPVPTSTQEYKLPDDHDVKLELVDPQISLDDKTELLQALLEILPRVGKDVYLGLSIVRVLVILTRNREIAAELSKKQNLQRLFLMVKQLAGIFDLDFQKTFMIVLRHMIEDDKIIEEAMRVEIKSWCKQRPGTTRNTYTLPLYIKSLAHLIIRAPEIFVKVTEELVKYGVYNNTPESCMLVLKSKSAVSTEEASTVPASQPHDGPSSTKPSTEGEESTAAVEDKVKVPELKVPHQERTEEITHYLLSQLLQYKDVEDKEASSSTIDTNGQTTQPTASTPGTADIPEQSTSNTTTKNNSEKKSEKPEFVGEQYPIFHYRCFILETLTELLEAYDCCKLEFVNFKQDQKSTTPSKPRLTILNYLLTRLIPIGTLSKVDENAVKKKEAQSQWSISVIVALCLRAAFTETSKSEDTSSGAGNDLTYIRKFITESAFKAFKDATVSDEPLDQKYSRLLSLSELFCRLLLGRSLPKNFYGPSSTQTLQKDIARIMFEKNCIAMLTNAVTDIDLNFPISRRAVKYILRPLKLLTDTAIELSQNADILVAPGSAEEDTISVASSISDVDMDREETPDLFRNSTLGILEPGRDELGSSESEDDDEDVYESGFDEEMDYGEEDMERDDDEVVSDEDDDEELDDADGTIEGLDGDHPMDVEVIIDGEEDSDEDDSEDTDDEDMPGVGELEFLDELTDDENVSDGHDHEEEDWEDDEGEELEEGEDIDVDSDAGRAAAALTHALIGQGAPNVAFADNGVNTEAGLGGLPHVFHPATATDREESIEPTRLFGMPEGEFDFDALEQYDHALMHAEEEEEDEEENGDDDEDMEQDYDDEGDAPPWGWDEGDEPMPVSAPRHHHNHHHHWGGHRRMYWPMDADLGGPPLPGFRQNGRSSADAGPNAGLHPLLQRSTSGLQRQVANAQDARFASEFLQLISRDRRSTEPGNLITSMIGAMGAGGALDLAGGGTLHISIGGPNGATLIPVPADSEMMRRLITGVHRQSPSQPRSQRHYDHTLIPRYVPGKTTSRWRYEAMMLCGGDDYHTRAQVIQKALEKVLVPAALEKNKIAYKEHIEAVEKEKKRLEDEKKLEDERLAAEKAERETREQKEKEEKEAAEREAVARAAEAQENEEANDDGAMEGVETQEATAPTEEPQPEASTEPEQARVIATFRGREVDISGLGIDLEYLDALPDELREEVLMQQLAEQRSQAVATGQDSDEISPEFLAALPDDIRQELLQQEARDRRRREQAEARRQAQANGQAPRAEEMDPATFLASLDPTLRASVLMEQDDQMLDQLPPAIAAEARALGADRARFVSNALGRRSSRGVPPDEPPNDEVVVKKPRHQIVQMLDKAGIATLLRLLFVPPQGNARELLDSVLKNIALNRQNRSEVLVLLLTILQEGSVDVMAIEKSFTHLSIRAKQSGTQKTPLKRTNTGVANTAVSLELSSATIIQQCLGTLVNLTRSNPHVPSFFLNENEGFAKSKAARRSKGKASKFAINSLLSLLDRSLILDSAGCMEQLLTLLQGITHSLMLLDKKDNKTPANAVEKKVEEVVDESGATDPSTTANDVQMDQENTSDQPAETTGGEAASQVVEIDSKPEVVKAEEPKKQRNLVPPVIPDENLRLVVGVLAAQECSAKTFRDTVSTISHLSAIPGAKKIFGRELIDQAQRLGHLISEELDELIPQIQNAKDSTDAQGAPAMNKFAAPAADQAKLLRVLTALDYIFDAKRSATGNEPQASSSSSSEDILAGLYESASFGPLWQKLSDCLSAMKDKTYVLNVATILLPLIESLMVICKNTTLKGSSINPVQDFSVASPEPESMVENLFFRFTEEHRKILNELVRNNPRLMSGTFSLLVKNPKVLEFDNKRNYFTRRLHSRGDQRRAQPPLNIPIRRDRTFLDSFQALYYKSPEEIKYGKLNIRFYGEEGVDAGGVTREWFQVMSRQMFDPNWALFIPVASDRTTFHPNRLSHINDAHLMWFKFIGRIIGKALYEGRPLDCHFSRAVYKKILGKSSSVKDMETLDLEYYKSLVWMLENDITDVVIETFSIETEAFGVTDIVDLIPDGRNIPVTEENKQEYVQLVVEYRLIGSVKEQLEHFLKGFHDIVPPELISIFNEQELELLISGLPEVDVEDWKNNTDYHQYTISSPQIQWFWRAVRSFDKEERAKLLQFVTGTSKVPLNGFKELEGMNGFTRFNIHRDYGNKNRLPSSHTCFNQLDLPEYESYETLRQRLYTAMTTGSDYFGFA